MTWVTFAGPEILVEMLAARIGAQVPSHRRR